VPNWLAEAAKRLTAGKFRESFAEVSFKSIRLAAKDRKIIY
jgi:hypothetical protein